MERNYEMKGTVLSVIAVVALVLSGCGKNIRGHEYNEFRDQSRMTLCFFEKLQKNTAIILLKWGPRAEERDKNQEICEQMMFVMRGVSMATLERLAEFEKPFEKMNCPNGCPHLRQMEAARKVSVICAAIVERTGYIAKSKIDAIAGSVGTTRGKNVYGVSKREAEEAKKNARITAADRKMIEELNQALIDAIKIFMEVSDES